MKGCFFSVCGADTVCWKGVGEQGFGALCEIQHVGLDFDQWAQVGRNGVDGQELGQVMIDGAGQYRAYRDHEHEEDG